MWCKLQRIRSPAMAKDEADTFAGRSAGTKPNDKAGRGSWWKGDVLPAGETVTWQFWRVTPLASPALPLSGCDSPAGFRSHSDFAASRTTLPSSLGPAVPQQPLASLPRSLTNSISWAVCCCYVFFLINRFWLGKLLRQAIFWALGVEQWASWVFMKCAFSKWEDEISK